MGSQATLEPTASRVGLWARGHGLWEMQQVRWASQSSFTPTPEPAIGWQCPPGLRVSKHLIAAMLIPCAAQGVSFHGCCVWGKRVLHRDCTKPRWLINPPGTKRHGVGMGCISPKEWVKHFLGPKTLLQRGLRNSIGCRALHRQMDSLEFSCLHPTSSLMQRVQH